jgi:hypothetical protein
MTNVQSLVAITFVAVVSASSHAQEIVALKIEQAKLSPNIPISIQVDFNLANVQQAYCGLEISFGDGDTRTVRAGMNGAQDFPLKLTHSYANPGKYVVKVEGKSVIRGLKSAGACQGASKQLSLMIADEAADRVKEDMAKRERELAAKQIELQQLAEKIEREKTEQAAKEQQLRDQELKMKRRELEQRDRLTRQKDSSRDAQTSPVSSPAPTPNRRAVDGF